MDEFCTIYDPQYNSWCVTKDERTIQCFNLKEHAINFGLELAQNSITAQLKVYSKAGSLENEWMCGSEPPEIEEVVCRL